jgi:two-component system, OmpR family, manganese sensing response regulator
MAKILLVEDDSNLSDMVEDWLAFERHTADVAADGNAALQFLHTYTYELIILDWELPGVMGIDICRRFRQDGGKTPILFLTGKSAVDDKEAGFEAGADDYLTKPFASRELMARVKALLRRPPELLGDKLRVGTLELDRQAHTLMQAQSTIQLSPREFTVLEFLMRHPNQFFTADALLDRVWPANAEVSIDSVRVCIKRIRSKLGDSCPIESLAGHGYRLTNY